LEVQHPDFWCEAVQSANVRDPTESGSTLPDKVVLYQIVGTLFKSPA
jgi:hypothetical protein